MRDAERESNRETESRLRETDDSKQTSSYKREGNLFRAIFPSFKSNLSLL